MSQDKITNFYEHLPKRFLKSYSNPSYDKHMLHIPYRLVCVGGSGSGKTTLVLEIIKRMPKTFNMIILCVKNVDEPLYQFLLSKVDRDMIHVFECEDGGTSNIPNVQEFKDFDGQILCIFDDLCTEKDQKRIEEYFIRGRKIAKGISMIYLTQSFYKTPKVIRLQCNYIILKKLSSMRDLNMIMSEFNLGVSKKSLLDLYNDATKERLDFLLIDIDNVPSKRFRKNFLQIYNISSI